jgi:hypothetical protein
MNDVCIIPAHQPLGDVIHKVKGATTEARDIRCNRLDASWPGARVLPSRIEATANTNSCIADLGGDRPTATRELGKPKA